MSRPDDTAGSIEKVRETLADAERVLNDVWAQWSIPDKAGRRYAGGLSVLEDVSELDIEEATEAFEVVVAAVREAEAQRDEAVARAQRAERERDTLEIAIAEYAEVSGVLVHSWPDDERERQRVSLYADVVFLNSAADAQADAIERLKEDRDDAIARAERAERALDVAARRGFEAMNQRAQADFGSWEAYRDSLAAVSEAPTDE